MNKPPQAKVSAGAQSMESRLRCVYNVTRGCRLNSKVSAVDSARDPLKVLKVLIEGLARDGESSLWLTPLVFAPNIMRLFPFDFAYLDNDLKVIEAVALPPGTPFPQFNSQVASGLIVPFDTFSSTGTCVGDHLIVCAEEELESRIAEISAIPVVFRAANSADVPITTARQPVSILPTAPEAAPFPTTQVSLPNFAGPGARGTASTLAMTSDWQIANSTMAAVLPEPLPPPRSPVRSEVQPQQIAREHPDFAPVHFRAPEPLVKPTNLQTSPGVPEVGVSAKRSATTNSAVSSQAAPIVERRKPQVNAPQTKTSTQPPRKHAENVPATLARVIQPDPSQAQKKATDEKKKKESLGVLVKRFLNCEDPLPERRSIIRLLSKELVAYRPDRKAGPYEVRDVSPTGLYLRTQERWQPGRVTSLTMQRKDAKEENYERRVSLQVRTVRCDEGGVGLSWMWPDGVEFQPWKRLHTKRSDETDADFFLRELRLTAALGFLRQICPSAVEEIKLTLHQRLSNKRVASAVEIALKAQEHLAGREHSVDKLAHLDMVRRILENGSWTEDNWIRQWWAGLLASSCSPDGLDTSNAVFSDLLAKLTPVHLRVLSFVCRKDTGEPATGDPAAKSDHYCTADELIEAVGSHSLARIQQTMGQLSSLGLLAETSNPSYIAVTEKGKTRIAPTALALKMHARCNGRR